MAWAGLLLWAGILHAGTPAEGQGTGGPFFVIKQPGQSDSEMVISNPPPDRKKALKKSGLADSICYGPYELVHGPISAKWNSLRVVFSFYEYSLTYCAHKDADTYSSADGFAYLPTNKPGNYKRVFIGTLGGGGREAPTMEAFFFANADRDKAQELGVLTSYEGEWKNAPSGKFYLAEFFDDSKSTFPDSLTYMKDVSENQVKGSCSAYNSDGTLFSDYYYQTVAEVKQRLKKLGY